MPKVMPILGDRLVVNRSSLLAFPIYNRPCLVKSASLSDLSIASALVSLPGPLLSCRFGTPGRNRFIMPKPFNGSIANENCAGYADSLCGNV